MPTVMVRAIEANPNCKIFAVRTRLTTSYYSWDATHSDNDDKKLEGVVTMLAGIEGVASILVHAYELWISKGTAYEWDELEPVILSLLDRYVVASKNT